MLSDIILIGVLPCFRVQLGMSYRQDIGPNWVHNMQQTKYTLAPRGTATVDNLIVFIHLVHR